MKFTRRHPECAYLSENLWLPKAKVNEAAVKGALEVYPTNSSVYAKQGVRLWKESAHHLIVPRYFIEADQFGEYDFPFIDIRPTAFPTVEIQHRVTPRDESQAKAIDTLTEADHGIINLACGKGKSTVALAAIANSHTPAIIVVSNAGLMSQWAQMIRKHLSYDGPIGLVQQQTFDWKCPITIAMIQTLAGRSTEWPAEFRRYFGVVVFDEVHHLSAPTFIRTADLFFGRRWGLTATPKRSDGLEVAYYYHLGRILYSDLEQNLVPETWFIETGIKPANDIEERELFVDRSGQENISKIRAWLGTNEKRNQVIVSEISKALANGRRILAITHSIAHAELLHKMVPNSGLCIGKIKAQDRLSIINDHTVTFATVQVAGEALDAPSLDTLFILTPMGDQNGIQQCLGRIQRMHSGKKSPLVTVFEDSIGFCHGLCGKMKKFLREKSYPFKKIRRA